MKNLLFWGICLVAWASAPALAQPGGPAVAVVTVFFTGGTLVMDVARPEGKHEHREFKPRDLREEGAEAELTRQLLTQLYQEGYSLTGTYGGGDRFVNRNTLVFTKRL